MRSNMNRFASNCTRITARPGETLSEDQIRETVPSAFALAPHTSRSAKYVYVPTADIVKSMVRENFLPVFACQSRPRDKEKFGHTKHMLRFRLGGADLSRQEIPEIILVNSHDGTSSYQLTAGVFRLVCTNGLIVGNKFEEVRVHHTGNIIDEVMNGAFSVAKDFERALGAVQEMKAITLKPDEQGVFAMAAADLRFEPKEGESLPISAAKLLEPRRMEDRADDLWTTFNRIQENVIQGGQRERNRDTRKMHRTREVKGIDQNVRLNRALWTLAEKMAELKK